LSLLLGVVIVMNSNVHNCPCYITPLLYRLYEHFKKSFMRDFDNFYMISFKVCIIF